MYIYTAVRARRWENKTLSEGHYSLEGTIFTSEFCQAGQYSPVNSVRGDIIHWGTLFTATTVLGKRSHFAHVMIFLCKCVQCYHT